MHFTKLFLVITMIICVLGFINLNAQQQATPPLPTEISWFDGSKILPLEEQGIIIVTKSKALGFKGGESLITYKGEKSPVRVPPVPTFVFKQNGLAIKFDQLITEN